MVICSVLGCEVAVYTSPVATYVWVESHHILAVHIGSLEACTATLHSREGLGHSIECTSAQVGLDDHLQRVSIGQSAAEGCVLLEVHLIHARGSGAHGRFELSHVAVELIAPVGGGSGAQYLHIVLHGRNVGGCTILVEDDIHNQSHAVANQSGIASLCHVAIPCTSPAYNGLLQSSEVGAVIVADAFLGVGIYSGAEVALGIVPHYNVLVGACRSGGILSAAHDTSTCAGACSIGILQSESAAYTSDKAAHVISLAGDIHVGIYVLDDSGTTHVTKETAAVCLTNVQFTCCPDVLHNACLRITVGIHKDAVAYVTR